jgi:hypothetical protein
MNKTMMQPTTCTDVKAHDRQSAADSSWTWRWLLNFKIMFVNLSSSNENEDVYDVSNKNYRRIHVSTGKQIQRQLHIHLVIKIRILQTEWRMTVKSAP